MSLNSYLQPTGKTPNSDGTGYVAMKDYKHAARIFTDANFRLSPKYGFLFYVEFDFNPLITSVSNRSAQELGMIVKSVSLPKYTIDTKTHNAYNRVNISQQKIKYDPITITFHDDQSDNVRNFWYDYYSFFYRDSDYADATYQGISKYQSRPSFDWGYSPRPTVGYNNSQAYQQYQYIQGIRIYSLYQKNFSEYQLVNPIISGFSHGEHNNSDNQGLVQHQMSIQFETVKYLTGYVTNNTVGGFVDLHYDNTPSPIAPNGGTGLVDNGNGGAEQATDAVTDLAYSNPLTQLGFVNQTKVQVNSKGLAGSSFGVGYNGGTILAAGAGNGGGFNIPSLGSLSSGLTPAMMVQQQLSSAAANLAGTVVSNAANGVIGGIAKGLGPNGTAIVGGIASAIANPTAAIQAVENLAINYAVQKVTGWVINTTTPIISGWSDKIASTVGGWTNSLSTTAGDAYTSLAQSSNYLAATTLPVDVQYSMGVGFYGTSGLSAAGQTDIIKADWLSQGGAADFTGTISGGYTLDAFSSGYF